MYIFIKILMNSLYVLYDNYMNGFSVEGLDFVSLFAILSGISVIIIKNPVTSVLFLIGLFVCIAGYLSLLGLNFIGLAYLLVYVGAVSILFLFILMLINVRVSELTHNTNISVPLAVITGISFNYSVNEVLPDSIVSFNNYMGNGSNTMQSYLSSLTEILNISGIDGAELESNNKEILYVTSQIWDNNLSESSHITSIGNIMYTSYSIWLILTSVILLLAMVGAIVITIKQK